MSVRGKFIDSIVQNRVLSHLTFWIGFLLIFSILASLNSGSYIHHLGNYVTLLPVQIAAAYFTLYFLVPKLLYQKKYVLFFLLFSLSIYVFSALARLSVIYIAEPMIRENFVQESLWEVVSDLYYLVSVYFPAVYVFTFLMMAIKAVKERFEARHQVEVLQREKVNSELQFLKAQIHPHFLFNTLNNLYALCLQKSDLAPQVVLKLSGMLDFMLYQCNDPRIPLSKEIEFIQSYLDLEQLRYGEKLDLSFTHKISSPEAEIAPLILLSFIENAFKHGASGNPINPKIHIELKEEKDLLNFQLFNNKIQGHESHPNKLDKGGIGNSNLQRQLELNYRDKYRLDIQETGDSYRVKLSLDLG